MYLFECEAVFQAGPDAVWKLWTDVARWPEWDVSKEITRLDGPFEPGTCGWAKQRGNLGGSFTLTAVEPGRRWVTECPLPLGKVIFEHLLQPVAEGRVRVVKRGCSRPECAAIPLRPWPPCNGSCPRNAPEASMSGPASQPPSTLSRG